MAEPVTTARALQSQRHSYDAHVRQAIELELVTVLAGTAFCTSKRSCDFLTHVVEAALNGNLDQLKERSIGIDLFGRNAGYDTGSDAAVRVRANDVRKRLAAHYEQFEPKAGYRLELPPGSYLPRFLRQVPDVIEEGIPEPQPKLPSLELRVLAAPTVLALFFCAVVVRNQLIGTNAFARFWTTFTQGGKSISIMVDQAAGAGQPAIDSAQFRLVLPLFGVADSFRLQAHVLTPVENGGDLSGEALIRIASREPCPRPIDQRMPYRLTGRDGSRRVLQANGRTLQHIGLITLLPDHPPSLCLEATDADALRGAISALTKPEGFPAALVDSVTRREPAQVLIDEAGRLVPDAP